MEGRARKDDAKDKAGVFQLVTEGAPPASFGEAAAVLSCGTSRRWICLQRCRQNIPVYPCDALVSETALCQQID